ncbi:hypothetical protein PPH41_44375, partial [Burkholderia gladioli]|nr:hypothetical protein [Burkholderia gladioli]
MVRPSSRIEWRVTALVSGGTGMNSPPPFGARCASTPACTLSSADGWPVVAEAGETAEAAEADAAPFEEATARAGTSLAGTAAGSAARAHPP